MIAGMPAADRYNVRTQQRSWPSLDALSGRTPMAEPPAAAPAGVAAPEQDALLATKLHVPRPQPGFLPRPRLVEALDEGRALGLILVCAPAGFGKTVLLADWARRGNCPVAWLSLDTADNDPARFWRHVVAALDRACPGIGERAGPLLGPPAASSFEGLVAALINELARSTGGDDVLLVLDDYHLIEAEQVHTPLIFLLEHRPPRLHLVLASRTDPPLPLARLRAGRQLAGLSLRGQADVAGFVAAFSGSHRFVLDYLAEEVLERQSEELRGFLLETSLLERLSGELCDAVTGRTDSQAMLEQVERANLFLVPLDEVRGWWRYHHLFADLLRARLQQERPGRVPRLHRNAAAWCDEHGLANDAVRHALGAGDGAWAARLIERYFDAVFRPGERATIQRWLSALPAELVWSRPRLLLAQTWMAIVGGDLEGAGPPLAAAVRAVADAADEPFEPSVGTAASQLANITAVIALARAFIAQLRGDAESTAALAARAQ